MSRDSSNGHISGFGAKMRGLHSMLPHCSTIFPNILKHADGWMDRQNKATSTFQLLLQIC